MSFLLRFLPWTLLQKDEKQLPGEVEFLLIGSGLPRTGTKSTHAAMSYILPGRCHHMSSVITCASGKNAKFWLSALADRITDEDWRTFMDEEGLSATVDFPSAYFWKKLLELYPNAKVLFTDRDPVAWYNSVKNTIYQGTKLLVTPPYSTTISMFAGILTDARNLQVPSIVGYAPVGQFGRGMFGAVEDGEDAAVKFYNAWKDSVISAVPQEKLLVFQVKDGWRPLCNFLGVEIPSISFPRMNDTKEVMMMNNLTKQVCHSIWGVIVACLAFFVYHILNR